jgi:hypothetical protein
MRITNELIEHFNACEPGVNTMLELFPNGGEYEEVLAAAKHADELHGDNKGREAFIRMMKRNPKVWLKIEGTKVKDVFHVFNPLTGQHITCNSLEEAKQTREQCIRDYVKSHEQLFTVAQEIETGDGNTLWNPINLDDLS